MIFVFGPVPRGRPWPAPAAAPPAAARSSCRSPLRDNIEILNQNIPYIADKLQIQKINTWKEMLSAFGIVTPASEKTERLVSNEVTAGLGYSEMAQNVGLVSRRQAVEHFNELFGTNVSVDFRSNLYADILGENTQGYTYNTYQDNTEDDTFSTQRTARQSKGGEQ